MKIHGITVANVTHKEPGNNLPKWVRQQATTRGYGDAQGPLSLYIQEGDIAEAFTCAAQGNGAACVMAQAGKRIGAKSVYFYRTTAWVDFGAGPIVRFRTSGQIYKNVVEPFDRGDRDAITPGIYHLAPPTPSTTLSYERKRYARRSHGHGPNHGAGGTRVIAHHTERVVMAAQSGADQ